MEDDTDEQKSNDNKILDTVSSLCKNNVEETRGKWTLAMSHRQHTSNFSHFFPFSPPAGDIRFIFREVVLLTNDRNLRVKALSNNLPVRELPDFVKWAGLSS